MMPALGPLAALALAAWASTAWAAPAAADDSALAALARPVSSTSRLLASTAVGTGLRFNNPYRLRTELGADARSVSLTAGYVDLGVAYALGPPDGLQHGAALRLSIALAGVSQQALTPSYLLAYRGEQRFLAYGRLGPSILLSPDPNVGAEVGAGLGWFLTAGLGLVAELVFNAYSGAGTRQTSAAVYPVLSGQLGLLVDYELLP